MDNKEKMKNIWAMIDKPLTDIVTKKASKMSTTLYNSDSSSDETNELELSDTESNSDFIALPKEFRPNLNINKPCSLDERKNTVSPKKSLKEQQIKHPNAVVKKPMENIPLNRSDEYPKPVILACKLSSPLQKEFSSGEDKSKALQTNSKNPQQAEKNTLRSNNNRSDEIRKNADPNINNSQKTCNILWDDRLLLHQPNVSSSNKSKKKKSFQYECVQKVEHRTLQLNFDLLSFKNADSTSKDRIKYETKSSEIDKKKATHTGNRNIKKSCRNTRRTPSLQDEQFPILKKESKVKWDSSLNLNVEEDSKFEWNYIREEKIVVSAKKNVAHLDRRLGSEYAQENFYSNSPRTNHSHNKIIKISSNLPQIKTDSSQYSTPKTNSKNNAKNKNSSSIIDTIHENSAGKSFENNSSIKYTCTIKQDLNAGKSLNIIESSCIKNCEVNGQGINNISYNKSPAKAVDFLNSHFQETKNNSTLAAEHSRIRMGNLGEKNSQNIEFVNNSSVKYTRTMKPDVNTGKSRYIVESSCIKNCEVSGQGIKNISCEKSPAKALDFLNFRFQESKNNSMLAAEHIKIRTGNLGEKNSQDIQVVKDHILHYGKEISDLVIGSYTALSMLVSFYREWTHARRELIVHFEELEKNLKESLKTVSKYKDIIEIAKVGVNLAAHIPHPAVSIAARIVSAITSLLNAFLKTPKADTVNLDEADGITKAIFKDKRTIVELQMYILQCSQQFEETNKLIKEFHSSTHLQGYFDDENPEMTVFIRGFLEYKPDHRIFLKKLRKCYQDLLQNSKTSFSKRFCEPFTLYSPSPIDVIEFLSYNFRYEDFDNSSVSHELEEIHRLIQNSDSMALKDLQKRIFNCIQILTEELEFREKCMKDITLFDSPDFSKF